MNKHEAMFNYISQYKAFPLTFNYSEEANGNTSLITVYSDSEIKRYLSGSQKEYIFAIKQTKPYHAGAAVPSGNTQAMYDVQRFMDWIDEQQQLRNYPDFGEDCKVQSIENLQNMPAIAETDHHNVQYMFQCRVVYYEQRR